ncbi:hypothetical protein ABIB57_000796 [Devosia sp. UYZn731]
MVANVAEASLVPLLAKQIDNIDALLSEGREPFEVNAVASADPHA